MATKKQGEENTTNGGADRTAEPAAVTVEQLGKNLGIEKAKKLFGADKAYAAMHAVAKAGGHGSFKDEDFDHPLFGGLQIPHVRDDMPEEGKRHIESLRAKINSAVKNL